MKSEIYLSDKVQNKERHPAANPFYYPATIIYPNGQKRIGMFTLGGIQDAIYRAEQNPEDIPREQKKSLWARLFNK
jgi:hypothetical protein